MKIAIDARMYHETGVGRYIRNLIGRLQLLDKKNEYHILLLSKDFVSFPLQSNFQMEAANYKWYGISEQIGLPNLLKKLRCDLVHFPHFNIPIFFGGKFVVTIHDLIHQHFQMRRASTLDPLTYKIKKIAYSRVFKNAVRKSIKILVPSNYVKNLLLNEWQIDEEKIVVTPESVDSNILTIEKSMENEEISRILDKFNIKNAYIYYVGNAHPHKNIEGLINSFLVLRKIFPNLSLVLSGHDHYFWKRIIRYHKNPGIIYTGKVSDKELVALYKGARCFVMPSFEEGFGIPLLEAMACNCPVVSSNKASLPEVAGEAAVYFNPNRISEMVEKIQLILRNENVRKNLIVKGKKRVENYSWDNLAKKTMEVYFKCVLP